MELKPCPFCGCEAVILIDATRPSPYRDRLRVGCETAGCRGFYHAAWAYYETLEQAAEAWNTRAERTGCIKEHETGHLVCSECGAVQTEWTVYYCWNCGAKLETVGARRSRYSVDERIWVDADGYRVIISDCAVVEHE